MNSFRGARLVMARGVDSRHQKPFKNRFRMAKFMAKTDVLNCSFRGATLVMARGYATGEK